MEIYKAFSKELVDSLNSETPMEQQLAQTVADTQWRLNRARSYEDGMLALGHSEEAGNFDAASPEIHSALTAAKVFRDNSKSLRQPKPLRTAPEPRPKRSLPPTPRTSSRT
jgi:hypothetical protein